MYKVLPLLALTFALVSKQAIAQNPPDAPLQCPDANIAVLRAGMNADTMNPTYLYTVNTQDGTMSVLPGGPLVYPDNPARQLHVNGVGINRLDGFMYGLAN